jgi:hypothetical protein
MENTEINFKNYSFDDIQLVPTHDLNLERKWKYIERLSQRVFHSQNDGFLRVESEPGKTVFSVELPIPQS